MRLVTLIAVTLAAVTLTAQTFTAKQIGARVVELQTVTLEMNEHHVLDTESTRTIINWTKDADVLLHTFPRGWRERIAATWTAAKQSIHTTNPPVLEKMAAVDAVLGT